MARRVNASKNVPPVEAMAPAAVEVDLRGDTGAAAGELETGCRGGGGGGDQNHLHNQSPNWKKRSQEKVLHEALAANSGFFLLGRGIISTAVELVILVFVSSTRWYS